MNTWLTVFIDGGVEKANSTDCIELGLSLPIDEKV